MSASTSSEPLDRATIVVAGVVIIGAVMSILDATVVNVALDTLGRELHSSLATIQWVISGYTLALASVIPVSGWAADRFGAKQMWLTAVVVFAGGSLLCGVAWSEQLARGLSRRRQRRRRPLRLPGAAGAWPRRGSLEPMESAREFGPEVKAWAADEHGVVGDEREAPGDRGGGDPKVRVVEPLVEPVSDQAGLVAELRDGVGRSIPVVAYRAVLATPQVSITGNSRGSTRPSAAQGSVIKPDLADCLRQDAPRKV